MAKQKDGKLNRLGALLPEGLLVDAAWLSRHGYSSSLRSQYVASGWLQQPARQVYTRPRVSLTWQQVMISLQSLLDLPVAVGGRTALEALGFAHYLSHQTKEVHLYGPKRPPAWLNNLSLDVRFIYHNSERLFPETLLKVPAAGPGRTTAPERPPSSSPAGFSFQAQEWGPWGWQMLLSSPERAVLELLDALPGASIRRIN